MNVYNGMRCHNLWVVVFGWLFRNHLDVWIDKYGVTFYYKGDEVIWEWPHKRRLGLKYYDMNLNQHFPNLKEIDELWSFLQNTDEIK